MPMLFRFTFLTLLLVVAASCNSGSDGPQSASDSPAPASLEEQLKSILLKDEEVPEGLEGADLAYSTNEQLAGPSEEELQRLNALGRQLGVDITYVPVSDIPADSPARGGIQNSASVYLGNSGSVAAFKVRSEAARTNDWPANYTDLTDVKTTEMDRQIADETYWLRVTGLDKCDESTATPGVSPTPTCPPARLAVIDHILIRSGRTFVYLMVASDVAASSPDDVFAVDIEGWATAVASRASQTFPPAGR
ncbi:MAG: hypothetical protein ABIP58_02725 [Dehalococcoidia bacterium]